MEEHGTRCYKQIKYYGPANGDLKVPCGCPSCVGSASFRLLQPGRSRIRHAAFPRSRHAALHQGQAAAASPVTVLPRQHLSSPASAHIHPRPCRSKEIFSPNKTGMDLVCTKGRTLLLPCAVAGFANVELPSAAALQAD